MSTEQNRTLNIKLTSNIQKRKNRALKQQKNIRRPESAWLGNILCRIQTMGSNPKSKIRNPKSKIQNPKSKIQNPNGAVWGRHKKNED